MGRPMTPMPIKPICMLICPFRLFHFDENRSAFHNIALLVMNTPHFALVRRNDRMLHFHGAEDDQYLAMLHRLTILYLHFDDGTSHWRGECFLGAGRITAMRGRIDIWRLSSFKPVHLSMNNDLRLVIQALDISANLPGFL